jgi:hypothetical protein
MNLKSANFLGVLLLFLGLLWLYTPHLLNLGHGNHHANNNILLYSLPGLIPTLGGLYLMELNKNKNRTKK